MNEQDKTPNNVKGVMLAATVGLLFVIIVASMVFVLANGLQLVK